MFNLKSFLDRNKDLKKKQNKLVIYEDYGLNQSDFFTTNIDLHYHLSKWLDILIVNNIHPKIKETKEVLTYWNEVENKKFTKHQINKNTKTFKFICIGVTYRMFDSKVVVPEMFDAVDTFSQLTKTKILMYKSKINILSDFLWNSRVHGAKDFFKLSLLSPTKAIAKFDENKFRKIKYKNAFSVVKDEYVEIFWKGSENGYKEIDSEFNLFERFTRLFVESHKTKDMIDFNAESNEHLKKFEELIHSYFKFVFGIVSYTENAYINSINFILSDKAIKKYIFTMKKKRGWENFWEDPIKYTGPVIVKSLEDSKQKNNEWLRKQEVKKKFRKV